MVAYRPRLKWSYRNKGHFFGLLSVWNEMFWEREAPHRDTRIAANHVLHENGRGRHIIRYTNFTPRIVLSLS